MANYFNGQQIGAGIIRNMTYAQLVDTNYVFPPSVIIIESDTGAWKTGDGSTAYTSLAYLPVQSSETITAAGALSILNPVSKLALSGAGAVTLAAPTAAMLGKLKTIQMTTDNGDVTLALTNVVGQSSGTTATFNDAGDALVLIGAANSKWIVVKEYGISLS